MERMRWYPCFQWIIIDFLTIHPDVDSYRRASRLFWFASRSFLRQDVPLTVWANRAIQSGNNPSVDWELLSLRTSISKQTLNGISAHNRPTQKCWCRSLERCSYNIQAGDVSCGRWESFVRSTILIQRNEYQCFLNAHGEEKVLQCLMSCRQKYK